MIGRNDFVSIIRNLVVKESFKEINNILDESNFSIEVVLDYYIWLDEAMNISSDESLIGIIYDKNLLKTRSEFRNKFIPKPLLKRNQSVEDLHNISKKMIHIYRLNFFTEIEELLFEFISEQKKEYIELYFIYSLTIDISFRINGIEVFNLNGQGATEEEISEIGYNLEYFKSKVRANTDLVDITQIEHFSNFASDTKFFIEAGNQLLSVLQDNNNISFNDYSPYILDFLKALEIEIKELYLKFNESIIKSAKKIAIDMDFKIQFEIETNRIKKEELQYLKNLSIQILKFRKKYSPSGIKPLYYFMKYFAFNDNLFFIEDYSGFISQTKHSFLTDNENIISRLKEIGELRNKTIHSNYIGTKDEFLMNYYDIFSTLQLISTLKNLAL